MRSDDEKETDKLLRPLFENIANNRDMEIAVGEFWCAVTVASDSFLNHPSFEDAGSQHIITAYTATIAKVLSLLIDKKKDPLGEK